MDVARRTLGSITGPTSQDRVNSVSFNQTGECYAYAMENGFKIYTVYPQRESIRRDFTGCGLGIVEMLYSTNIMVLVGADGSSPLSSGQQEGGEPRDSFYIPSTKAIIWDDSQKRAIGELCHGAPVKNVKLGKNRIAVSLEDAVFVYDLQELRRMHHAHTVSNPHGLLSMGSDDDGSSMVAYLGCATGEVCVACCPSPGVDPTTKAIQCHNGRIVALSLSSNGRYLATASEKGTLIRIFSTEDGSKVQELRRGRQPATIYSLAFSLEPEFPTWLACTSDKGTLHIFYLSLKHQKGTTDDGRWLRSMLPGKPRKRSSLQFRVQEKTPCLVSFHASYPDTVTVLSKTGTYSRVVHFFESDDEDELEES